MCALCMRRKKDFTVTTEFNGLEVGAVVWCLDFCTKKLHKIQSVSKRMCEDNWDWRSFFVNLRWIFNWDLVLRSFVFTLQWCAIRICILRLNYHINWCPKLLRHCIVACYLAYHSYFCRFFICTSSRFENNDFSACVMILSKVFSDGNHF